MHFVTSQRAISTTNAFGHVHYEQIDTVDYACFYLLAGCCQTAIIFVAEGNGRIVRLRRSIQDWYNRRTHLVLLAQPAYRDLNNFSSCPHDSAVWPVARGLDSLQTKAAPRPLEIDPDRIVTIQEKIRAARTESHASDPLHPSVSDIYYPVYGVSLPEQEMTLFINGESSRLV
jgi:hypothetical protein